MSEEKCLCSRLVFSRIKADHLASYTGSLCTWILGWARGQSSHFLREEDLFSSLGENTSPPWPRSSAASSVQPPWHPLPHILATSILQFPTQTNCSKPEGPKYKLSRLFPYLIPSWIYSHSLLPVEPLIGTSTGRKSRSWGSFNQVVILPFGLTADVVKDYPFK